MKLTARQISVALPDAVTSQGSRSPSRASRRSSGRDVESTGTRPSASSIRATKGRLDREERPRGSSGPSWARPDEELIMDRQKSPAGPGLGQGDLAPPASRSTHSRSSRSRESGYIDLLGRRRLRSSSATPASPRQRRPGSGGARSPGEPVKIDAERDVELRRADVLTQTRRAGARGQAGPLAQAEPAGGPSAKRARGWRPRASSRSCSRRRSVPRKQRPRSRTPRRGDSSQDRRRPGEASGRSWPASRGGRHFGQGEAQAHVSR